MRKFLTVSCLVLTSAAVLGSSILFARSPFPNVRQFELTYAGVITEFPEDAKSLRVWVPLASDREGQKILERNIETPAPFKVTKAEGSPSPPSAEVVGGTSLDFKVGKVVLGHDGGSGLFLLDVHEAEADEEPPMVRVWGERPQLSAFADDALKVCAAGRPLCPLCGGPINPDGHSCPRVNGHHRLADVSDS